MLTLLLVLIVSYFEPKYLLLLTFLRKYLVNNFDSSTRV